MELREPIMAGASGYRDFVLPSRPPAIPLGLEALYTACKRTYPDQPNPLQVTAVMKYWLGGPDPLDYISMYSHPGDTDRDISPHWHYVSFGLSDLHGDGRVHNISGNDSPSGFGFELTFRLKREREDTVPPTWPAAIMQALAKYVFQSENILCAGDHVSWHCPLDNSESRIQHMLMYEDPQLGTVLTPFGPVTFIQIVGVCAEELQAAQRWNGPGIINIMKSIKGAGGPWLVTDMRRGESVFELDPCVQDSVDHGIEAEGSNLSGVSAKCFWQEKAPVQNEEERDEAAAAAETASNSSEPKISVLESEQIKATLKKGLLGTKPVLPPIRSKEYFDDMQYASGEPSARTESRNKGNDSIALESELLRTQILESIHLQFNLEAGSLLPLVLRGRLKHGRHFTFKSVIGDIAITLVPTRVAGAFVDSEHPYAAHGRWLQVLIGEELIEEMLRRLADFSELDPTMLPKTVSWPERKLSITFVQEDI